MFDNIKNSIDYILFGSVIEMYRANKIVQSKINECKVEQFKSDERIKHTKERLESDLVTSLERIERIEGKAMGTLLGVSVAISVFGAAFGIIGPSGVLGGHFYMVRILAGMLLVGAMIYLVASGYLSLQAYRIGEVYRPTLDDREPLVKSVNQAMILLYCIEQNYRIATLRSNRLSVSFNYLRNGLTVILLIGILIVIVTLFIKEKCRV